MASSSSADDQSARRKYCSPPHALLWSFRKSRDNWKRKYLDVKAELKRTNRRLDRLNKAKTAATCSTQESPQRAAAPAVAAAFLEFLHQRLLDLQQQIRDNPELFEQCQRQQEQCQRIQEQCHRHPELLLDLAQQIQRLQTASPLLTADAATPVPTRRQPDRVDVSQPPKVSHQAPKEPKKGAPRQHGR